IDRFGNSAEVPFDDGLDLGRIKVADRNDCLEVWPIPIRVERPKPRWRASHDTLLVADRQPFRIERTLERDRQPLMEHPITGSLAKTPLFAHHAAFVDDFRGVEDL